MRAVPSALTDALATRDFTGPRKATTRVTVQKATLGTYPVGDQTYASIVFPGATLGARELPNVRSLSWQRSVDTDVAGCTFELWNTAPLPPGSLPEVGDSLDQLGYYTFNRARSAFSRAKWGHTVNQWQDMLVPDRVVRVYQGYGADYSVLPEDDPHLVLTGCWIIDDVTYTADGLITVECRDFGRLLQDQIAFPPVVPLAHYPLSFDRYHQVQDPITYTTTGGKGWHRPAYDTDSNVPRRGLNGDEYGHHGTDAFDGSASTYWLSTGNARPDHGYSFEYIQGKTSGRLAGASVQVWGGPYTAYLSVRVGSTWQGSATVPYDPNNPASAPNGANVPFLHQTVVPRDGRVEHLFDPPLENVTAVRWTFTNLFNSGLGTYRYRAGVRTMEVLTDTTSTVQNPVTYHTEGNYQDYGDIVRLLLAYGGFYWPQNGRQVLTGTHTETLHYTNGPDPYLQTGRVWADVMSSTNGPNSLDIPIFDKKPLLEGITYIRDLLGFLFFIDESGAAIFRLPNLFERGNYVSGPNVERTRTQEIIALQDDLIILGLRSKLSSRNIRERVVIADTAGLLGAVARGRFGNEGPPIVNFRRVGMWTDQNFSDASDVDPVEQAQVMADMICLRQLFTYRQNSLRIPADPRIQVDDQVQITERTTGEHYLHYVSAIASEWSAEDGRWTYDLTTSWLGTDPTREWAFVSQDLSPELKTYLAAVMK